MRRPPHVQALIATSMQSPLFVSDRMLAQGAHCVSVYGVLKPLPACDVQHKTLVYWLSRVQQPECHLCANAYDRTRVRACALESDDPRYRCVTCGKKLSYAT